MKKYSNYVIINGIQYTNLIEAFTYKEALKKQKERKRNSKHTFKGRLQNADHY